jgi:hypothetical protein
MMNLFINYSETKGVGSIISHQGLVKGDLITVEVKNEIFLSNS